MMEGNRVCTHQGNNFLIFCLFKQCLKLVLRGYFPTNCWLGTKSAGLLSHLNQDQQCFPRKHGRQQHKRGPSLCEHVQTCKHRPSDALCMASVSEGGETPKTNLSIAVTDKSGPSWKLVRDVGGWVASCSQTTEGRASVLVDMFLTDHVRLQVM